MALLYEYAIMLQEKRDMNQNIVEPAKLIGEPGHLLAKDDNQARLLVGAKVPDEIRQDPELMDRVVVISRPF